MADYVVEACRADGLVTTTARSGGDLRCDLNNAAATRSLLADVAPDVIVHAAGLTDVDLCEREPAKAFAANRDTVATLVGCLPASARLVMISTDQVYGDTSGPHGEDDPAPVNVYGRSKLEGEMAALKHAGTLVLRTNFFGPSRRAGRQSLSDFIVWNLTESKAVTLFADVVFSPLHMATLAALVVESVNGGLVGVFNAGCRDGATKAKFALAIARHKGLQTQTARIGVSTELTSRAPRILDLRLDVARLENALGRPMPTLEEEIGKL